MSDDTDDWQPTGKWARPVIYSTAWRRVLAVDALIGLTVTAIGVTLVVRGPVLIGAFIGALGLTYLVAVGRRVLQWRWLRRRAGLDGGAPDRGAG